MNKREKEVLRYQLNEEKKLISELEQTFADSLSSVEEAIKEFQTKIDSVNTLLSIVKDERVREILESQKQSAIYQRSYQEALKQELDKAYSGFTDKQYESINQFLEESYKTGFAGAMYDLHGQQIPMLIPIDQNMIVRAVQNDSKISEGLYERLGYNTEVLKKEIVQEVSRGISTGSSWMNIAHSIMKRSNVDLNKSIRIARTESHKVSEQGGFDAAQRASEKGADLVKQWGSVLDNRTREDHRLLDGQFRELNEMFEVNGHRTLKPGEFGIASEDINCRCTVFYRARWAIDEDDAERLNKRAEYYKSIAQTDEERNLLEQMKSRDFAEFRSKYLANSNNVSYTNTVPIGIQFFAKQQDLKKQPSKSIRKGINSYQKTIEHHLEKISNPEKYCDGWDEYTEQHKAGLINHWKKEIQTARDSIRNSINELKERGEYDE